MISCNTDIMVCLGMISYRQIALLKTQKRQASCLVEMGYDIIDRKV
jgi:hypothetical protein